MKVALVYDRVNKIGGAERILEVLHELYPQAPLYTLVYDKNRAPWAKDFHVIPSFLQWVPLAKTYHEFFPILPLFAFEQFDFSTYDVVISLTATEAKGIITAPRTLHLCYLLTPTRYLWSHYHEYFNSASVKTITLPAVAGLRMWDQIAANRPDTLVAISKTVARRIKKYYRRDARVIYPPVDVKKYQVPSIFQMLDNDYFLIVSRLVKYKRIDIAIEACNQLKLPLKIVGSGLEQNNLKKIAGPTIEFLGNLTDDQLYTYYQNCRGLLMPQAEDFGITAIEALSFGKPVIAYKGGGAVEFIEEGKTGEFFYPQTTQFLVAVLEKFHKKTYTQDFAKQTAMRFSIERFKKEFAPFVINEWERYKKKEDSL